MNKRSDIVAARIKTPKSTNKTPKNKHSHIQIALRALTCLLFLDFLGLLMSSPAYTYPSRRDEMLSTLSHFIGALLAISGLVLVIVKSAGTGQAVNIVACSIFGLALVSMYSASSLYHFVKRPALKNILRKVDHINIFLLIAGTYTPVVLIALHNALGWVIFGVLWGIALLGFIYKFFSFGNSWISTILYVLMGWTALGFIVQVIEALPTHCFLFILLGGMAYTSGVVFYMLDETIEYCHAIWHMFVFLGSLMHFFAVYFFLAGMIHT